jgi:hypothetical protein
MMFRKQPIIIQKTEWTPKDELTYKNFLNSLSWETIRKKFVRRIDSLKEEAFGEMSDSERRDIVSRVTELSDFLLGFDNDADSR